MKNQENQNRDEQLRQNAGSRNNEQQQQRSGSQQSGRSLDQDENLTDEDVDLNSDESNNRTGKPSQQSPGRNR